MVKKLCKSQEKFDYSDISDALATAICHAYQDYNGFQNSKKIVSWKSWVEARGL